MQPVVVSKRSVGVEHGVGDHQRYVELPLGELRTLIAVGQGVERGQSRIDVLGGEVLIMVVVPQSAGILPVRISVGLDVAGRRRVVGIAVVLRQRRRAVQVGHGAEGAGMQQAFGRQCVANAHLAPGALPSPNGRPWEDAVVAGDRGRQARHKLRLAKFLGECVPGEWAVGVTLVETGLVRGQHRRAAKDAGVGHRHVRGGELALSGQRHGRNVIVIPFHAGQTKRTEGAELENFPA